MTERPNGGGQSRSKGRISGNSAFISAKLSLVCRACLSHPTFQEPARRSDEVEVIGAQRLGRQPRQQAFHRFFRVAAEVAIQFVECSEEALKRRHQQAEVTAWRQAGHHIFDCEAVVFDVFEHVDAQQGVNAVASHRLGKGGISGAHPTI